jgi:cytochrome P450
MLLISEIFFFTAVSVLTAILLKTWSGKKKSSLPNPPSIPSLPLVGSLPFMRGFDHLPKYFLQKSKELGPIFTFKMGSRRCLVLNSFEAIEEALVRNATCYADRPGFSADAFTGNKRNKGIVNATFDSNYKRNHKLSLSILREFGFGIRQTMETRISTEVREIIDYINTKNGQPFDPEEMCLQASSNVGLSMLFSQRDPYDKGLSKFCRFAIKAGEVGDLVLELFPWLRFFPPFSNRLKKMIEFVAEMNEHLEQLVKSIKAGETDECFVSRYIEKEGPNYDHENLIFTLRDLALGATDTTANTLQWTFLFLANNQSIQKSLQRNIDEAVPRNRLPAFEDKSKLPYLDATILEVMRLRTLIPLALPHRTMSDSEISGFFIAAGTTVFPNIYAAHMDSKTWSDPDVFRPERFLDEDNNITNREKSISFSMGRRSCLGEVLARQELIQFISGIVQNFTILPAEDNQHIDETEVTKFITKAKHFKVRMIPRTE